MTKGAINAAAERDAQAYLNRTIPNMSPGIVLQQELVEYRKSLASHLPEDVPAWLRSVPICLQGLGEPNACALRGPNGHPIIAVDYAMATSVIFVSRLFLLSFDVTRPYLGKQSDLPGLIHDENFRRLFQGLNFARLEFIRGQVHDPRISVKVSAQDRLQAGLIAYAMLEFVVAHELAHIQRGHLDNNRVSAIHLAGKDIVFYTKSHDQEFEADEWGARLFKKGVSRYPNIVFGAPLMLIKYLEFLDSGCSKTPQEFRTHPPAQARFKALEQSYGKDLEGDAKRYLSQFTFMINISIELVESMAQSEKS